MDDPCLVGHMDGPGEVCRQLGCETARLRGAGQTVVEAAAVEQLQSDKRQAIRFADVINLQDVRVAKLGDRLGLGREPPELVRMRVAAATNHFQGDQAVEPEMPRLVDYSHPSPAQPLDDLVSGDVGTVGSATTCFRIG